MARPAVSRPVLRGRSVIDRIAPGFASTLPSSSCGETDVATALHVLPVLDEISPGGRLAMALTRLARSPSSTVASKAALMLGRRVQNPLWVERQMMASDGRMRANVIESLWGVNSPQARRCLRASLHDPHHRVVANALVGLHLLGDQDVAARLKAMITHPNPRFQVSAAWAMGRIGDRSFMDSLRPALEDPNAGVRAMAARALAALPAES